MLLVAQIRDYGVDQATIGITFLTGSAGFVLAGVTAGSLIHRGGTRMALLIAGGVYVVAGLYTATRPSFVALVLVQLLTGYGTGLMESVLNAYLAALPRATVLINRLHAFFGVGALLGPLLGTRMLAFTSWPMVALALVGFSLPLLAAVAVTYPRRSADPVLASTGAASTAAASAATASAAEGDGQRGALLITTLRQRGILLGATLLAVYVGIELGLGNWGFSYLVEARGVSDVVAGYTVSGYWLGLTLGRFLISPIVTRLGFTAIHLMYLCVTGVGLSVTLTWLLPVTAAGFVLLGFFLGPIFPTTMALAPQLTVARLMPTAIGVMNAGSVVGGSALPWLAGAVAQSFGAETLLPFMLVLTLVQFTVWWRMTRHTRSLSDVDETPGRAIARSLD